MKVYLIQHGNALTKEQNPERPLSDKGKIDLQSMGEFLEGSKIVVSQFWHSGKTRARQTAEILCYYIKCDEGITDKPYLAPNDCVEVIFEELEFHDEDILIAGHMPFLSKLAAKMLCGNSEAEILAFEPATIACFERKYAKCWTLNWLINPHLLSISSPREYNSTIP